MKEVEKGNFSHVALEVRDNNEIGRLSRNFNTMTREIQNLMEQTTGNFEVNQGKEPTRVTTASGIALMNERAKSRQTLKKAGRTEGFKRLYSLIDYTALEFYEKGSFRNLPVRAAAERMQADERGRACAG